MVDAVTSIEDRRFFQHSGVNFMRLAEAAWIDFTHQRHQQGGSTITMQLSRAFFLSPEKTFKRKLIEMLIAVELEQKFSKQQIFEFYANRVDLGQRGIIHNFRLSRRFAILFQQRPEGHHPAGSRTAGRIDPGAQAICRPIAIPSAHWNGAIRCSSRWWKRTPSPASKRIRPKPRL